MARIRVATRVRFAAIVAALIVASGPTVRAQSPLTRVSVDANGQQGNGDSNQDNAPGSMSADGRWVAFASVATNLVPNDKNKASDVFVRDQWTGAIVRVSVNDSGVEGNGGSSAPALSRDGRFVAFESGSRNFAHDTNSSIDIYLHDRDPDGNGTFDEGNGKTTRVSVASGGGDPDNSCYGASISADGAFVAFIGLATNLVSGDTNGWVDVFVRDVKAKSTIRVSAGLNGVQSDGPSWPAQITANGNAVAFVSYATNLVSGDTNGRRDAFLADLATGSVTRVSVDSAGGEADDDSQEVAVSADGRWVAFSSGADDLVANDANRSKDIFVKDTTAGSIVRASVDSSGAEGYSGSFDPAISDDGSLVAFVSVARNLVPGDVNGTVDVFFHDMASGATGCSSMPCGIPADFYSFEPFVSADGTFVGFKSWADNLVPGDTNGVFDVFVHDRSITAAAAWSNYGAGFPGTNGVPSLGASALPKLGTSLSIDVTNSLGTWSVGQFFVGTATASIPTRAGGTLLVGDLFAFVPFVLLPATPTTFPITLPFDPALCGFHLYLQALELDAGAAYGLSFTPGLELDFGG